MGVTLYLVSKYQPAGVVIPVLGVLLAESGWPGPHLPNATGTVSY